MKKIRIEIREHEVEEKQPGDLEKRLVAAALAVVAVVMVCSLPREPLTGYGLTCS